MSNKRPNEKRVDGLAEHPHRIFLTVTLKKSIVDPDTRTHILLSDEQAARIARFLCDFITQDLAGRRGRLNLRTFLEVGPFDRRRHLHIAFDNPNEVPFERIEYIVAAFVSQNVWTHKRWDMRQYTTCETQDSMNTEADLLLRLMNIPTMMTQEPCCTHLRSLKDLLSGKERLERQDLIENDAHDQRSYHLDETLLHLAAHD